MSVEIRSHRAGLNRRAAKDRPLYARALGLQYLHPSEMICFFFFEGAIILATLLALAELVSWWAVLVLPAAIAVMVKINDVISGFGARAASHVRARAAVRAAAREAARRAAVPAPQSQPQPPSSDDELRSIEARRRQSAAYRYDPG
jgi:hypothetical protein